MRHAHLIPLIVCMLLVALTPACRLRGAKGPGRDYARPLPPGAAGVRELPVTEWPRFALAQSDREGLQAGIARSLAYLKAPSSQTAFPVAGITHEQVRQGLERFAALLAGNPDEAALNSALREQFRVFTSVGYDGRGTVLTTGYYTPIFEASLTPDDRFRHPIHRRPADLVSAVNPKDIAQQRLPDGSTRPYPTRAELEDSGVLKGLELAWLADPYDPYNIQVQGSAKLRLRDGRIMEVGFDGTNGHPYVSVGRELAKDGVMDEEDVTLQAIRDHFGRNPGAIATYTRRNPRFIFFKEAPGGPFGSLGQPVTRDVTVATDKEIFPRAAVCFLTTRLGNRRANTAYAAFRLDQDTGGAIRAPGRCDLYMGEGVEGERRAGVQRAEGRLYYLIAK